MIRYHLTGDMNEQYRRCLNSDNCAWATPQDHYNTEKGAARAADDLWGQLFLADGYPLFVRFRKTPDGKHVKELLTPF